MKTKNVNNAIEDWLGGRADRAGREWLAGEMAKDPELAREVNLRRRTDEILADRQVMELRSKLSVIGRKTCCRTSARYNSKGRQVCCRCRCPYSTYFQRHIPGAEARNIA